MSNWASECESEITSATTLEELDRVGRRLSVLGRELEGARATVAMGEIRSIGLDAFLSKYGGGATPAAHVEGSNGAVPAPVKKGRPKGSKNVKKATPKKATKAKSSGEATTAEVLSALAKGKMNFAALRSATGGKRTANAVQELVAAKKVTLGSGVGAGRIVKLA
jgi:hypothetical protein